MSRSRRVFKLVCVYGSWRKPDREGGRLTYTRDALPHCRASATTSSCSLRRLGEVGLVLGVGGAVVQFDVDPARRDDRLFEPEPDGVEVCGLRECAEAVEAFARLVVDVYPRARRLRVLAAGRKARRGGEHLGRVLRRVIHAEPVAHVVLAAGLVVL